jgi:hypothetical protein
VETAISAAITGGARTQDIALPGEPHLGTREIGEVITRHIARGSPVESTGSRQIRASF